MGKKQIIITVTPGMREKTTPVFPQYDVTTKEFPSGRRRVTYTTMVRKKDKKIWFTNMVICTWEYDLRKWNRLAPSFRQQTEMEEFLYKVYAYILAGKPSPHIVDAEGKAVFMKDDDQRSEEERLNLYITGKDNYIAGTDPYGK